VHDTDRLLRGALEGDSGCQAALFSRHLGRLLALVRARMSARARSVAAPEDIVQETHLEASRKLPTFEDRGPASFYRWLVAIARFKMAEADRAGAAGKRQWVPIDRPPSGRMTSPSGRAMRRQRDERLARALGELGEARAEAVRLRYLEGLSVAETAERLGRSEAAVKALVSRGLEDLAAKLTRPG
jgi:RNA polymerase sigma-70 factor (ECF subfamily)